MGPCGPLTWIAVNNNLACIISDGIDVGPLDQPVVYIFQKAGGNWKQIRKLVLFDHPHAEYDECRISGDNIAVQIRPSYWSEEISTEIYRYDQEFGMYKRIQDPLVGSIASVSLDQDYLVLSKTSLQQEDCFTGFSVYQRETNQLYESYVLRHNINSTDDTECKRPYAGAYSTISHDGDATVAGGANSTHIFIQDHDGYFDEVLILDKVYPYYRLSGRNVLVATYNDTTKEDEVHAFSLEKCASTPTQVPSTSVAPSATQYPTVVPSELITKGYSGVGIAGWSIYEGGALECPPIYMPPTLNVSLISIPPNEICYWVNITVVFDNNPSDYLWG